MAAPRIVPAHQWRTTQWRNLLPMSVPAPQNWIHHSGGGPPTLATLRGNDRYHVEDLGWRALGYSFAYGQPYHNGYATIYVGRGWGRQGGHTSGHNTVSHGHLIIGNWSTGTVPEPIINSIAWNIRDGARRNFTRLLISGGHRNAWNSISTTCPGNAGMRSIPLARNALILPDPEPEPEGDVPVPGAWFSAPGSQPAIYRNGQWFLRKALRGGPADHSFYFGASGDVPLVGRWSGGLDLDYPGVFRDGQWFLRRALVGGPADVSFMYGRKGDVPVVGRWSRAYAVDGIGVFRDGVWLLRFSPGSGDADIFFTFGRAGDIPVTGDWNGNGQTTVGVYRDGTFYLKDSLRGGDADHVIHFGRDGDVPVTGDWNGNGRDTIGVVRNGRWFLKNSLRGGNPDIEFSYGL